MFSGNTHHGMSSSISSYNVNGSSSVSTGGGYQSSPERKSSKQRVEQELNQDTDMEMSVDDQGGSSGQRP